MLVMSTDMNWMSLAFFFVQPMELRVPMCCEKCVKKVKDRILSMPGTSEAQSHATLQINA